MSRVVQNPAAEQAHTIFKRGAAMVRRYFRHLYWRGVWMLVLYACRVLLLDG
jgi:hypothetical protein